MSTVSAVGVTSYDGMWSSASYSFGSGPLLPIPLEAFAFSWSRDLLLLDCTCALVWMFWGPIILCYEVKFMICVATLLTLAVSSMLGYCVC